MSTTLSTTQPQASALAVMASRLQCDTTKLLDTLKSTVFKGATNEELMALCVVANAYGLNPFTREVFAFPAKGGGITPVVSVDGWLRIINEHKQLDGIEFSDQHNDQGTLIATTCRIWRKDRSRAVEVTEYLSECKRNTEPWKMEHRMLRHKALIQCARVAFGFSGIYDEDEAERIKTVAVREIPAARVPSIPFLAPPARKCDGNHCEPECGAPECWLQKLPADDDTDHIPFDDPPMAAAPAAPPAPPPAKKRAQKATQDAPPLVLEQTEERPVEKLRRLVREHNLDGAKVDAWLDRQSMPTLSEMYDPEADGVLGMFDQLKEAAR